MRIRTVWAKYDRTFPTEHLGKGSSVTLACTVQADIEETEVFVDAIDDLFEVARLAVRKEFDRLPKPGGAKKSEACSGKEPQSMG